MGCSPYLKGRRQVVVGGNISRCPDIRLSKQ